MRTLSGGSWMTNVYDIPDGRRRLIADSEVSEFCSRTDHESQHELGLRIIDIYNPGPGGTIFG